MGKALSFRHEDLQRTLPGLGCSCSADAVLFLFQDFIVPVEKAQSVGNCIASGFHTQWKFVWLDLLPGIRNPGTSMALQCTRAAQTGKKNTTVNITMP